MCYVDVLRELENICVQREYVDGTMWLAFIGPTNALRQSYMQFATVCIL